MSSVNFDLLSKRARVWRLMFVATLVVAFSIVPWSVLTVLDNNPRPAYAERENFSHSDLNKDGVVDLADLIKFSDKFLGLDWQTVDWCQWIQDANNIEKYGDKYRELFIFIHNDYQCDQPPPPPTTNDNEHPLRLALGPDGKLYVSNAQVGSVFIYEAGSLNPSAELKGLGEVLGVAVDSSGSVYVGRDDIDIVEVYNSYGTRVGEIGGDEVKMPNDLAFDRDGNLYVVDSERKKVWVYDSTTGTLLRSIGSAGYGAGRFRFPCSLTIWYRTNSSGVEYAELYVADQGQGLVQIFDLDGTFLRSFGGIPTEGMMGWKLKGKFARLQSLQVDGSNRLHALDSQTSSIQILNPDSGVHITTYGSRGSDPGQLRLPLDMVIDATDQVIVANYGNNRIEMISVP